MTKAQATNGMVLTVGGLNAILALATQLGYLGPKEQITELRTQRTSDLQRIEALETASANVGNDVGALARAMCMATDKEEVWVTLTCSTRLGRPFDATIAQRRR